MYDIIRTQKVIDPKGKPKVIIPLPVAREWGFPKQVLLHYDKEKTELIIKPSKKGEKRIVDPNGKPRILLPKAVAEDWGYPRNVLVIYCRDRRELVIKPLNKIAPKLLEVIAS